MLENRVEVKFLEKVEPYEAGEIGLLTEKVVQSLGDKVERIEKQIT